MKKIIFTVVLACLLAGCAKWDEASERAACEKSNPGDKLKAEDCYNRNKQAADASWAGTVSKFFGR
jgi:hypothetical protein